MSKKSGKSAPTKSSLKQKALEIARAQIEKRFGKGSIMKLGDDVRQDIEAIPTGALSLDIALGIGGVPRGRIIEIYGPEASGKTTLALHILAEAQKAGGTAAFIDAEHALDPKYAAKLGVDVENLYVSQPDFGEQALEILETLVRSGGVDIIVIDSVAALTPRAEIEGEMGDAHMGLQARLMSQALRKITAITSKTGTTIIFLNQIRMKIGVMFGNPETTTGGNALKFYSSVRMDIRTKERITEGEEVIGRETRVKIVKNKIAPPFKEAWFEIYFDKGIDRETSILAAAVQTGVLERAGAWYKLEGKQIAQGRDGVREAIKDDEKLRDKIVTMVKERAGIS
ncbi:recombinase RecA [Candidatus Dojkabacteria bacterium]|nr:recombinase RecA [Candidatus Dojkabacteria bacterium]